MHKVETRDDKTGKQKRGRRPQSPAGHGHGSAVVQCVLRGCLQRRNVACGGLYGGLFSSSLFCADRCSLPLPPSFLQLQPNSQLNSTNEQRRSARWIQFAVSVCSVCQSVIQFLWLGVNREPSTYFSFTVKNGKNSEATTKIANAVL